MKNAQFTYKSPALLLFQSSKCRLVKMTLLICFVVLLKRRKYDLRYVHIWVCYRIRCEINFVKLYFIYEINAIFLFIFHSVKYRTMFECVKTVAHDCVQGAMSESQVDFIINGSFNESNFCLKGFFGVPKSSPGSSFTSCTSTYDQKAPLCGKAFHQKFATDWSDPSLCR